ncbi:MAG: type-F conjugative transfer system secretin TraK [Alphaproteobacteria bacterium]|jgi:archaellum component FlaG (FlaF/FlaG flagellin family)|nr:type-F conjugative transfer system secretin TraK [Alphaproteobacteria bacterium]
MNKYLMSLGALVFAFTDVCYAHTPLNPGEVLEFPISKTGMTRITIDNDGIEDIYAYPTEYGDNISHHKSGHIFVVAEGLNGPLYVTLITKRGAVQDLKLIPKSKKAEPILLTYENAESRLQQSQEDAGTILASFVQGIIPKGFFAISADEVSRDHEGKSSLEAIVENAYQNEHYRVLVFKVKNVGQEQITLDNRVLWEARDLASAFDQSQLNPDQSGKLFVIQNR